MLGFRWSALVAALCLGANTGLIFKQSVDNYANDAHQLPLVVLGRADSARWQVDLNGQQVGLASSLIRPISQGMLRQQIVWATLPGSGSEDAATVSGLAASAGLGVDVLSTLAMLEGMHGSLGVNLDEGGCIHEIDLILRHRTEPFRVNGHYTATGLSLTTAGLTNVPEAMSVPLPAVSYPGPLGPRTQFVDLHDGLTWKTASSPLLQILAAGGGVAAPMQATTRHAHYEVLGQVYLESEGVATPCWLVKHTDAGLLGHYYVRCSDGETLRYSLRTLLGTVTFTRMPLPLNFL